ncbi:MAG: TetR/AcrR family transcriptional regulator [Acidobacteria bacterium]|nr:TetR/AcrR family transcriptional regulator [Acidobacteriota bacterium]
MTEPPITTKDRILDVAERLFADCGFEATSLRTITAEAGVNLASVNYHFQSKEALLHAVFERRVNPVNRRRLELLDACEAEFQNEPIPLERLLEAFFRPLVLELGGVFPKLFVRFLYLESPNTFRELFAKHLRPIARRFFPAFHRSLPGLDPSELFMRIQFAVGGMAQLLAAKSLAEVIGEGSFTIPSHEVALEKLIQFAAAAMRSPVSRGAL